MIENKINMNPSILRETAIQKLTEPYTILDMSKAIVQEFEENEEWYKNNNNQDDLDLYTESVNCLDVMANRAN